MYKKVPAIKRKLQSDKTSMPPIKIPITAPIKQRMLEMILKKIALFSETPVRLSTAKSPISCGNS
jgi:hypothetical protein